MKKLTGEELRHLLGGDGINGGTVVPAVIDGISYDDNWGNHIY